LLQSEFLNEQRDDMKEREATIELRQRIKDKELLLEFLLLLQHRKQEVAEKLQHTISFLCCRETDLIYSSLLIFLFFLLKWLFTINAI